MLALVTNHMDDNLHLGLRLIRVGDQVAWENIETGTLHGTTYGSVDKATSELRRLHEGAGAQVKFMRDVNPQALPEQYAA